MQLHYVIGIKGMKSVIGGSMASMLFGGASLALASPHPMLSNISAVVGILTGIATMIFIISNTMKTRLEARKVSLETDMILSKCNHCESPEDCVFNPRHRPNSCKFKPENAP